MSDAANRLAYTTDLNKPIKKTYLDTLFATMDRNAHWFEIAVLRGGTAADLSGYTVKGCFVRLKDDAQRNLTGKIEDGKVVVVLDEACYAQAGQFTLSIKVIKGDEKSTVFFGEGTMFLSETDNTMTDEYEVINLENELNAFKAEIGASYGAAMRRVTVLGTSASYSVGDTVTFDAKLPSCNAFYGMLNSNSTGLFQSVGSSGAMNIVSHAFPSASNPAIRIARLVKAATDSELTRTVENIKEIRFSGSGSTMTSPATINIGPIYGLIPVDLSLSKGETAEVIDE